MDIKRFTEILKDPNIFDYEKMSHKYSDSFDEFLSDLAELYYTELPIMDFNGAPIVFSGENISVNQSAIKLLLEPQYRSFGTKAAEEEIIASSAIEGIDFNRDSVRNILKGYAPEDEQESRIFGQKRGLEFISDANNKITEENLHKLYMMSIGDFSADDEKLKNGCMYRDDAVYVVSDHIEHSGIECKKIPLYMKKLIAFVNQDDDINDLVKAAIIHFYIAYIHPYFDGNGRISRLVHLWFLIQKGYKSTLFIPFSSWTAQSRKEYYNAFTLIENNSRFSHKIDVTPFVNYFVKYVYNEIPKAIQPVDTSFIYSSALKQGLITEKETKLWQFALSQYGIGEFSTKQLEKDYGDVAYATIRAFVLKFEQMQLLDSVKYGQRVKYAVRHS